MGGPAAAHAPDIKHPPDDMGADGHLMGIKAKSYPVFPLSAAVSALAFALAIWLPPGP